ncbi:MAG: hypothetical protein A4E53_00138 [Pelotomaculum sp. PtaB.Bin104]|nr:MAG: hypothetical protein A4E53_00138 [Pelotomaculum sp. PtaB.Bin104]
MLSWEKVFFILGIVLLLLFAKSFSNTTKNYLQYGIGALFLIMVVRHAPEMIDLVKKYAETVWPLVYTTADHFIEAFGRLIQDVVGS